MISKEQQHKILSLPGLKESIYHDLDIEKTLSFFKKRYVNTLTKIIDIKESNAIDCGCGYGWFSFAYLLSGGKSIRLIDYDSKRLQEARLISEILNINPDSISFEHNTIDELLFLENTVDIFVSIETLEHIGKLKALSAIKKINMITSKIILITTPNQYFPVIAHDTRIPMLHWFSIKYRPYIAKLFGKSDSEHNEFLTPFNLSCLKKKFRNIARCLSFLKYKEYLDQYPLYLPYGDNDKLRIQIQPSLLKRTYFRLISKIFGTKSYYFMPSLTTIFVSDEIDAN